MEYKSINSSKYNKTGAHLAYNGSEAILIDPEVEWESIKDILDTQNLRLVYILVTAITFEKTHQIAEIKKQTGAKFLCFQSDLIKLRNLPRWADEKNVCGVKIPHVDGFISIEAPFELSEFETTLTAVGDENLRQYQIGKLRVPTK